MSTRPDRPDPHTPDPSATGPLTPTAPDREPAPPPSDPEPLEGYAGALPSPAVRLRDGVTADETAVRMLEEGAVKYNTFPSRPGYPSGRANLRTHLHVEAWVRNTGPTKHVWADVHVSTMDGGVVHTETLPLVYARPAGDGGEVFLLDRELYQGLVATPGSVSPRPDARVVQYRLYAELDGRVFSDGRVHQCYLKPDAMSG
jgi:hypothetical protein